ncbi:hypothetical protein ACLB1M_15320 [Escherichia coli]
MPAPVKEIRAGVYGKWLFSVSNVRVAYCRFHYSGIRSGVKSAVG